MKSITELLRDADPLPHEAIISSEQCDYRRKAILREVSGARDRIGAEPRSRIILLVAVGLVIVFSLLAERMWSPLVTDVHAAVRFEVRLAENEPAPGLREAKISGTDHSVYLHNEIVVTNSDISEAQILQDDRSAQFSVDVRFNAYGTEKMRAATTKHLGKPLAVLLDGQVIMVAKVRSPIVESAVITGNLSHANAERIVKGITMNR